MRVHSGYGMSETCPLLCLTHLSEAELEQPAPDQVAARIKTGVAVPMVDLRIIDASGNEVVQDGEALGEIVVRAPWLTQGYLNAPSKARSCGKTAGCIPVTLAPSTPWASWRSRTGSKT
jgi:fatty-acyl-CoA synthase